MNNLTENEVTLEELQNWALNNFKNVRFMDDNNLKLDVMDITVILQSVGFKLDKFEQKEYQPDDSSIKVDLMCSKSGLSTTLSKNSNDSTFNMNISGSSTASQVLVSASSNIAFPQLSATRQKFIRVLMGIMLSVIKKDDTKEEFKFVEPEENAKWLPFPPRASSPQPNLTDAVRKVKKETNTILGNVMDQLADLQRVIDSNLSTANTCTFVENGRRISDIASNPNPTVINVSPPKSGRIRKLSSPKIKTLTGTKKKWDFSTAKVGSFRQNSASSLQKKSENKLTPQGKQFTMGYFQEKTNPDTPIPHINSAKKSGAIPKRNVSSSKLLARN